MMRSIFLLTLSLLFLACSKPSPKYQWKHQSAIAFENYKKEYLQGEDLLAKHDLSRAIYHAKMGSSLSTLAHIYLGECALTSAFDADNGCHEYLQISALQKSAQLEAYYHFIRNNLEQKEIPLLPQRYQVFATALLQNDTKTCNKTVQNMQDIPSLLIIADVMKHSLTQKSIAYIIKQTSAYGYKKATLYWMQYKQFKNKKQKEQIMHSLK